MGEACRSFIKDPPSEAASETVTTFNSAAPSDLSSIR